MARENLYQFLVGLSSDASLQEQFKNDSVATMEAAGLTKEEQALVAAQDEQQIRTYLGDDLGPAGQIKICF